jgi:hypothetical protein
VAGRMGERDEDLARSGAGDPHVSLRHRVAAGVAMLIRSRSKIRFAVCRCFGGAVLSASRIASMRRNQRSELRPFQLLGPGAE